MKNQKKIILVGDAGVGKTSLLKRFIMNSFDKNQNPTIACDFFSKNVNGYTLQFWDTAGQERFKSITQTYYRNAHAIFYMYDISSPKTFDSLIQNWIPDTKKECLHYDSIVKFIIAGKSDLLNHSNINSIYIKNFAQQHQMYHFILSAQSGIGIHPIIEELIVQFNMQHNRTQEFLPIQIKEKEIKQRKKWC